jgi:hypothetical protein
VVTRSRSSGTVSGRSAQPAAIACTAAAHTACWSVVAQVSDDLEASRSFPQAQAFSIFSLA